jgi:hypothetical protein
MTNKKSNLALPHVNLNGTPRKDLFEGYCAAYEALSQALRALNATNPNGRDYRTDDISLLTKAFRQHYSRIDRLYLIQNEIEALAEHVMND